MRITERHLEEIPQTNLRIPVREFARVWLRAEIRYDASEAAGEPENGYLSGVCATCEWLAGVYIKVPNRDGVPQMTLRPAPLTTGYGYVKAYEELIAAETSAAEQVVAARLPGEPGFPDGVLATLLWAWRRSGVPPIEIPQKQTR
ncbi:hypothetical protein GCM10009554_46410 [Kribbella koreensis]|uniref:Uncharacterized protein n=1 Tax=Kribbella koreensis TaxID=57909 RepID=A0ABN1QWV4_9ACTN